MSEERTGYGGMLAAERYVFKYPVPLEDTFTVDLPGGAEILCVQTQRGEPQLWALVDLGAPREQRRFRLAGTGHAIESGDAGRYVGSFQMAGGELVFHLFEVGEP